jgi:hypothetical protein
MPAQTSFNSEQYGWSDVTVQVGNRILTGIQSVRYKESQEKGFVYGKGNTPLSIQRGNKTYEGSIKILQSELDKLIAEAPNKSLLDIRNMTISVGYQNADGGASVDNLIGVEFTDSEKSMEQNKQFMEVELTIMFLNVQHQA